MIGKSGPAGRASVDVDGLIHKALLDKISSPKLVTSVNLAICKWIIRAVASILERSSRRGIVVRDDEKR